MNNQVETRILLLRHAETLTPQLFHGAESDVGINEEGRSKAAKLGQQLALERPAFTYCSSLRRARETAEPIAQACGTPLGIIPELHERKMGPLSGLERERHWPLYEKTRLRWSAGELDFTHEGGESFRQVRDRVVPVFEKLAVDHPGQTLIVVAHGIVIRVAVLSLAEGYTPAQFAEVPIANLGVHDLTRNAQGWRLTPWEGQPAASEHSVKHPQEPASGPAW